MEKNPLFYFRCAKLLSHPVYGKRFEMGAMRLAVATTNAVLHNHYRIVSPMEAFPLHRNLKFVEGQVLC